MDMGRLKVLNHGRDDMMSSFLGLNRDRIHTASTRYHLPLSFLLLNIFLSLFFTHTDV